MEDGAYITLPGTVDAATKGGVKVAFGGDLSGYVRWVPSHALPPLSEGEVKVGDSEVPIVRQWAEMVGLIEPG